MKLGNNVAAAVLVSGVVAAFFPLALPVFIVAAVLGLVALLCCGVVAMLCGRVIRGAILAGVPVVLAGVVALAWWLR